MSLELQDLSVDIAGRRIVTDVGLTVPDGSFAGLIGPNGSGKSTILKAIYRVHRPAAGRVLLDQADLLSLRPKDAARTQAPLLSSGLCPGHGHTGRSRHHP